MLGFLVVALVRASSAAPAAACCTGFGVDLPLLGRLAASGAAGGDADAARGGVFATATVLAGSLDRGALAAHQIALSAAAFAFMVPLGVSSAAAVRVGHAMGRRQPAAARRAGWTALLLAVAFMSARRWLFVTAPRADACACSPTRPGVIATGVTLLAVAAAFQLFDGLQVVATGALRGVGDTRTPMLANLAGHWMLGLPIGVRALLPYRLGRGRGCGSASASV